MRTRSSAATGKRSVKGTGKRNKLLRRTGDFVGTGSTASGCPVSIDVGNARLLFTGNGEERISPSAQVLVGQTTPRKPSTVTKRHRKLAKAGSDQVATAAKREAANLRMIERKDELGHRVKAVRMKSITSRKKSAADKITSLKPGCNDLRQNCVVIRLNPMDVKSCNSDPPFGDNPNTTVSGLFTLHLNSQAKTLQLPLSMDPKDVEHLLGNVYRGRQTNAIIESILPSGHLGTGPFTSPPPNPGEAKMSPPANPPKLTSELGTPPAPSASMPSTVQHTGIFPPPTLEPVPTTGGGTPVNGEAGCCSSTMEMTPLSSLKTTIMRINQVDCRVRTGRAHFPIKKRLSVHYKQSACRSEDSPSDEASPVGWPPLPHPPQGMPRNPSAVLLPRSTLAPTGGAPPPLRVYPPALENLILPRPTLPPQTMMVMMSTGVTLSPPVGDSHEASKRLAIVLPVNFLSPAAVNASLTLQHQPQLTANQLIFVPQVGSHPTGGVAVLPPVGQVRGPGAGDLGGKRAAPTCRVTNSLTAPIPASLVVPSGLGEVPMQTADSRASLFGEVGKVAEEVRNQPMDCLPPVATVNGIDNLLAADRYLSYCSSISTDASSISATELSTSSIEVTPAPPLLPVAVQPPPVVVQSTGPPVGANNPSGNQDKCQSGKAVPASAGCHQLMPCLVGQSPMSMVGQSPSNLIGQSPMSLAGPCGKSTARRRGPTGNTTTTTTGAVRAGRFRCQECGMACLKACLLRKHIRTHYDVRPYMCQHCNIAFKTRGNLSKHMKSRCHTERCSKDPGKGPAHQIGLPTDSIQIDTRALEKQRLLALGKELVPEVKRPTGARYRSIRACPTPDVPRNKEEDSELTNEQQPATTARVTTTPASPRIPAPNVNVVHLQQELPLNLSVRPTQPTSLLEYSKEALVDKSTGLQLLLHPPAPSSIIGKTTAGNGSLETAVAAAVSQQQQQLTPVSSAETIIRSAVAAAMQSTNIIRQLPDAHPTTSQCINLKVMTTGAASPNSDGGTPCATRSCFTPSPLTTSQLIDATGDPGSNHSSSPVVESSARLERRQEESTVRSLAETSSSGEEERREPRPYKCSACRVGFRVTGHLHKHYRAKSHLLTVLQANNLPTEVVADSQLSPSDLIDPETGLLKETVVVDERLTGQQQRTVVGARDGI